MRKELIRSGMPELLAEKGLKCKCVKLGKEEYKVRLAQWFLQNYNQSTTRKTSRILTDYAEMLEVIRTWRMMYAKVQVQSAEEDPTIAWYKRIRPHEENVKECRIELLGKFEELLSLENEEVIVEQLQELTTSLKNLIVASGLEPEAVNLARKQLIKRFGNYVPLKIEKVSRIRMVEVQSV